VEKNVDDDPVEQGDMVGVGVVELTEEDEEEDGRERVVEVEEEECPANKLDNAETKGPEDLRSLFFGGDDVDGFGLFGLFGLGRGPTFGLFLGL
jgi:hypothetical protein